MKARKNKIKAIKKYSRGGVNEPTEEEKKLQQLKAQIESLKGEMRKNKTDEGMDELSKLRDEYKQLNADLMFDGLKDKRMRSITDSSGYNYEDLHKVFVQKKFR